MGNAAATANAVLPTVAALTVFERYSERARRVLFFARYEASQLGAAVIEPEHLLLGLLREGKGPTAAIFRDSKVSPETIRSEIGRRMVEGEKRSPTAEVPFAVGSQRVLRLAAEEADRLAHAYVGTEHLLLGLLREEQCSAAVVLRQSGIRIDSVRDAIARLRRSQPAPESRTDVRSTASRAGAFTAAVEAVLDSGRPSHRCQDHQEGDCGHYNTGVEVGRAAATNYSGQVITTVTKYQMTGRGQRWICNGCVWRCRVKSFLLSACLVTGAFAATWLLDVVKPRPSSRISDLLGIGIVVFAFAAVLTFLRAFFESSSNIRDELAIKGVVAERKAAKVNVKNLRYFTRAEEKKLKARY
jgi:hypothetical protein